MSSYLDLPLVFTGVVQNILNNLRKKKPEVFLKEEKLKSNFPANIYLFKVNNRNTRKSCEICSKLTIKLTVFLLLTLNIFHVFF